jgi:hypothetical protein
MALAEAIAQLAGDGSRAAALAAAARRRVETELSFAARMARVESIYEQLIAERQKRRGLA